MATDKEERSSARRIDLTSYSARLDTHSRSSHILGKSLGLIPVPDNHLTNRDRTPPRLPFIGDRPETVQLDKQPPQLAPPRRFGTPALAAALPMTSPSIRNFSQLRGPPVSCFSGGYPPRPPRPRARGLQLPLPATTIGPFIMDFRNFRQKGKNHALRLQMLCYSLPPTQRCRVVSAQGWRACSSGPCPQPNRPILTFNIT